MASDDPLIVELFNFRRESYDELDVLRLTRATAAELRAAIREGEVEPFGERNRRKFVWADVALLAMKRWTPRMITQALARQGLLDGGLPRLNQTRTIQVELPGYLHWLAQRTSEQGKPPLNVSDVLERQLDGAAGSPEDIDALLLEQAIPGYLDAAAFPREVETPEGEERCIYCGTLLAGTAGACGDCAARHEDHHR